MVQTGSVRWMCPLGCLLSGLLALGLALLPGQELRGFKALRIGKQARKGEGCRRPARDGLRLFRGDTLLRAHTSQFKARRSWGCRVSSRQELLGLTCQLRVVLTRQPLREMTSHNPRARVSVRARRSRVVGRYLQRSQPVPSAGGSLL